MRQALPEVRKWLEAPAELPQMAVNTAPQVSPMPAD
jgi:hypothetical protein